MRLFFISAAGLLLSGAIASANITTEGSILAITDNFALACVDATELCDPDEIPPEQVKAAQSGLEELEQARTWMENLGFPVQNTNLPKLASGQAVMQFERDTAGNGSNCGANASACFILDYANRGRIHLPAKNIKKMMDGRTMIHEFVHTIQAARDPAGAKWVNEMVATAVAAAWARKTQPNYSDLYGPDYNMTLDRIFDDGEDDPGYGKWDFAIYFGKQMGSADGVAYLAHEKVLNAVSRLSSANHYMDVFFDPNIVGGTKFEDVFPAYVAQFNNLDPQSPGNGRSSKYLYYGNKIDASLSVPHTDREYEEVFGEGVVVPFSADTQLISLDVTPTPERPEAENILLATVEIKAGNTNNLHLVVEHRKARERLKDYILVDGNDPSDELGFYRAAFTPGLEEQEKDRDYELKVTTKPVLFEPPQCFRAGQASEMIVENMDDPAENWRFVVDNGTAKGRFITPASAGKIKIEVEIDSNITRQDTVGLAPKEPEKTKVELGTFDVVGDDCMIRLNMGQAKLTYVVDGAYTEFAAPSPQAMYLKQGDIAMFDSGWMEMPLMARQMMLAAMSGQAGGMMGMGMGGPQGMGSLMNQVPTTAQGMFDGIDPNSGVNAQIDRADPDFMFQMPKVFSERFSWQNLRNVPSPDGSKVKRKKAPCPDAVSGCTGITISMDGQPVPVVFDASGRPLSVRFQNEEVKFEYGTFNVRRPPGW